MFYLHVIELDGILLIDLFFGVYWMIYNFNIITRPTNVSRSNEVGLDVNVPYTSLPPTPQKYPKSDLYFLDGRISYLL